MMHRMWMKVGRGKFFLIFGLSLLFGLSERGSTQGLLPFHLLAVLNDQYYFVFAVLPVFLFLCTGVMEDDMLFVLVRYGTYGRYFFRKWRALSVIAVFFWLVQMAALLCYRSGASHRRKLAGSIGRTVEGGIYASAGVSFRRHGPQSFAVPVKCFWDTG